MYDCMRCIYTINKRIHLYIYIYMSCISLLSMYQMGHPHFMIQYTSSTKTCYLNFFPNPMALPEKTHHQGPMANFLWHKQPITSVDWCLGTEDFSGYFHGNLRVPTPPGCHLKPQEIAGLIKELLTFVSLN